MTDTTTLSITQQTFALAESLSHYWRWAALATVALVFLAAALAMALRGRKILYELEVMHKNPDGSYNTKKVERTAIVYSLLGATHAYIFKRMMMPDFTPTEFVILLTFWLGYAVNNSIAIQKDKKIDAAIMPPPPVTP